MSATGFRGKIAVSALLLFSIAGLYGDVIAWYKFDEKNDGERALCSDGKFILDASGNDRSAKVVSVKHTTEGDDDTLSPVYRSVCDYCVYDPVSGDTADLSTALDFTASGTKNSQTGAVVKVGNFFGEEPPDFGSITLEVIVCTTGAACNVFAPIVGLQNSETSALSEHWSLMMNEDGFISSRFSANISYAGASAYSSGTHKINDGYWHSVALVHDATESVNGAQWKIYVDGKLDYTYKTGTKASKYNKNVPLYIGGYSAKEGRIFNGLIGEVRISDSALKREELLRVRRKGPIDSDTFVYIPFDGVPGFGTENYVNLNIVPNGPSFSVQKSSKTPADGDTPIPDYICVNDRPCERLSAGRFAEGSFTNRTALFLPVSSKGNGVGLMGDRRSDDYTEGSFTSEIFFKINEPITASLANARNLFRYGPGDNPPLWLKLGTKMHLVFNNRNATGNYEVNYRDVGSDHEFYDGRWHHVAVVYDRDAKRLAVYVDRRIRYFQEGVYIKDDGNYLFFINNNVVSDNYGYFTGYIDEFRFTKRALIPNEFLCGMNDAEESDRDTLLRASFENNWKVTSGWGALADALAVDDVSFVSSQVKGLAGDMIWTNAAADAACITNRYAGKLAGGYIGFPELPAYEGDDLTIEMFLKCDSWDETGNIFRLLYGNNPAYDGTPICALYPATASGAAALKELNLRVAFTTNYVGKAGLTSGDDGVEWFPLRFDGTGRDPLDGRWHHLALVASTYLDSNGLEWTRVTLYVDYLKGGSKVYAGHLPFRSTYSPRPRLSIGAGVNGKRMRGMVDEIRLTARALQPAEFLSATRFKRGMSVVFR